ncbi:MAG: TetR/AcrR family transcriptional regulator [Rhodobacteraceae bacterium]|nr:TetR/AcrR family transcriptional regulator [Paracoccaceae bacterium]
MTLPQANHAVEERSHEILFSIRQAFAEKGFDGASMQDLARAAGMSVGNFYRYFPSKAAIVEAMVGLDLAQIQHDFAEIIDSSDPLAGLRAKILQRLTEDCEDDGGLWAEITAAAIRKPEIAIASQQMEAAIVTLMAEVFARVTGRSMPDVQDRYAGHSQMLVMLVKAVAMRTSQCGPASPAVEAMVVRAIDMILNDISNDIAKG